MASLEILHLGLQDYEEVWQDMQDYTDHRDDSSPDQIWFLEHNPVFTQGQAGKAEHLLATGDIPVIQVDRGGQVTYHGPGQLVAYTLIDIRRLNVSVRCLVSNLENAVISVLQQYGIDAESDRDRPGVYITSGVNKGAKICSVGLRIRRGRSFHGLAFNIKPDLTPFARINPCGYAGLEVTSMAECGIDVSLDEVAERLGNALSQALGYNTVDMTKQVMSDV